MPRRYQREIPLSDGVRQCEKWATNVVWPAPIDERLSALLDLAIDAGEADTLSRSELIAAIVLAAPADGEKLASMLRTYRKAKVGDAIVREGNDTNADVIMLRDRRPGRR